MSTKTRISSATLRERTDIDVAAIPATEEQAGDVERDEWEYCTVYVSASYAGFFGRAFMPRTSFRSQEAFESDPVYIMLVEAALLDLSETIQKAMIALDRITEV